MSTPPNGSPLVRLSGRRRPESPQATFALDDPSAPPATRAECPTYRPCDRFRCRFNLDTNDERAGRPYDGRHPEPVVRPRHEEQLDPSRDVRASCVLDTVRDENGNEVSEGIGLSTAQVAKALGIGQRRVEQLERRALDKQWFAHELMEVVEDWAELKLYPRGGVLALRWGVGERDGHQVARQESKRLYVMIEVDLGAFDRATDAHGNRAGVTVRKRGV